MMEVVGNQLLFLVVELLLEQQELAENHLRILYLFVEVVEYIMA